MEPKRRQKDMNGLFRIKSLSGLDDDVLSHILSFLPLKEAIRTSILSKRWQYLWVPIPVLDFTQTDESLQDFMNFVQRAFSLRGSSKVTKFKLIGRMDALLPVEALISAAARCNVEDCELHLKRADFREYFFFPYSLLNLATLTHLRMDLGYRRLIVHPSICLPNLKTLKLCHVVFFNQQLTQNLFSGCHVLENLHIQDCFWEGVRKVIISSAKLQQLIIEEPSGLNAYRPILADEFIIHGDGLTQFNYTGQFYFDYCILNTTLLKEVNVRHYKFPEKYIRHAIHRCLKFLRSCVNVPKKTLKVVSG